MLIISTTCRYSQGLGVIWLDNLGCTSSDVMLSTCSHSGFGIHNCVHSEDVAVSCSSVGEWCHCHVQIVETKRFLKQEIMIACTCMHGSAKKFTTRVCRTGPYNGSVLS